MGEVAIGPSPDSHILASQNDRATIGGKIRAETRADFAAVAQNGLALAERAADDGRLETAKRIAETALSAARKAEDDELVKKATLRWLELQ